MTEILKALDAITSRVLAYRPKDKGFSGTPFWTYEGGLSVQHPSQIDMFGPRAAAPADKPARDTA